MTAFLPISDAMDSFGIRHVTLASNSRPSAMGKHQIFVKDGRIAEPSVDVPVIDAQGAMLLPSFVDMHTHLDKGHIWPRAANPDGTFMGALLTVHNDRQAHWSEADVRQRMEFALKCAYAHGTRAIRTHLDSLPPQHQITWAVFDEVRQEWQDKIELQAVTILGIDLIEDNPQAFQDVADTAANFGGVLGCVTYPMARLDDHLDVFFQTAAERGMDADFHVDETHDPKANTLLSIAQAAERVNFSGTIVVGHCCSLARQSEKESKHTLDRVAKAKINVVSLPMCNLYLQDRKDEKTPLWRGVTLVHEMRQRGIRVAFASDNTRDPFYAYGDLDMVEVMREATRICHLDHSKLEWFNAFSALPAEICGFSPSHLQVGDAADFIVTRARNWSEFFSRPQSDRIVVRHGRVIDRQLPDYRELDNLFMVK